MGKINLQNTIIVTINCVNPNEGINAIKYSQRGIKFKDAVMFTHFEVSDPEIKIIQIEKLKSVDEYNDFVLSLYTRLKLNGIDFEHCLIVQDDGFVTCPELWDVEFIKFDYIGAPWPNEQEWINLQRSKEFMQGNWNRIGNGGFSLRSKKFMDMSSKFISCLGYGEDVFLCSINGEFMKSWDMKFPPIELAIKFSYENPLTECGHKWNDKINFDVNKHFGFHGKNFLNSNEIINLKNKL